MTTAALRCAVISDPRIFENEPTWNSNYSSSNYTLVKGSPSSTFFFFFLNFNSFISNNEANATNGERMLSGTWDGLLCSLMSEHD